MAVQVVLAQVERHLLLVVQVQLEHLAEQHSLEIQAVQVKN
jgi:hypothetical protein